MLDMIKGEMLPQVKTLPSVQSEIAALKAGLLEQGEQTVELSIKVSTLRKDVNALPQQLLGVRAPPQLAGSPREPLTPPARGLTVRSSSQPDIAGKQTHSFAPLQSATGDQPKSQRNGSPSPVKGHSLVVTPGSGNYAVAGSGSHRVSSPDGRQRSVSRVYSKPIYDRAKSPHGAGTARSRAESPIFAGTAQIRAAESPTGFHTSPRVATAGVSGPTRSIVAPEVVIRTTSEAVIKNPPAVKSSAGNSARGSSASARGSSARGNPEAAASTAPTSCVSSLRLHRDGVWVTRHNL